MGNNINAKKDLLLKNDCTGACRRLNVHPSLERITQSSQYYC